MATTTATLLFDAGYSELVCVVPPGAALSARSKLNPDDLGKVPGRRNQDRTWGGYDWRSFQVKRGHAEQWDSHKANIGLRAGAYPAVDIDCSDAALSAHIQARAHEILGRAPVRIGRAPKALLAYRSAVPFGRMRLWLTDPEGVAHLVEVLGDGQQYVVAGTHPTTKSPYEWDVALHEWPVNALPTIAKEDVERFLAALEEDADILGLETQREGQGGTAVDREGIDQPALAAPSLELLERVVAALPNGEIDFVGRDDYLRVGYAIKAAGGEPALPFFLDWAAKWPGNGREAGNDPEVAEADWHRMVPPFEVGYRYLVDKARELGGYDDAADEFEATEEPLPQPAAPNNAGTAPPAASAPPSQAPAIPAGAFQPNVRYADNAIGLKFVKDSEGGYRYCEALSGWLLWRGGRWIRDEEMRAPWRAAVICNRYAEAAAADASLQPRDQDAIRKRLCSIGARDAALNFGKTFPGIPVKVDDLDADPMALNTPAGLLDLRTGLFDASTVRPLVTKQTAVSPRRGPHPRWSQFLREATNGDQELIDYLQLLAGYCLTGLTKEQVMVFMWGSGGNGKSVFVNALSGVMGDYATSTPPETFSESKGDRHPTELASLRGARLVVSSETQAGRYVNEARFKQVTGGDAIKARFMNQDEFEYTPQFKLLMLGNHKPGIKNLDFAMQRRIHMIPFTHRPAVVDKDLAEKLKEEWPEILQWAIDGCVAWQLDGLQMPKVAAEQTRQYFDDENPLASFIRERCVVRHDACAYGKDLFEQWMAWAAERNEHVGSMKSFLSRMEGQPGVSRWTEAFTKIRGLRGLELVHAGEFETQEAPTRASAHSSSKP